MNDSNCSICGTPMSEGARFCGACGKPPPVASPNPQSPHESDISVAALRAKLADLGTALRELGTADYIVLAIDALAVGPSAHNGHLTVVIGEKGRGKTTLVNRLLGDCVLPIGRDSYQVSLRLHSASTWQTITAHGERTETSIPVAPDLELRAVDGPASVLQHTTLLDTPPLNEVDLDFEKFVVSELVHADAFLICLSASQLLSQNERDVIRHRLLPFLGGDGALVVTNTDIMDDHSVTDEDRHAIHSRAERFARSTKLPCFFLPADPTAPATDVLEFITLSSRRRKAEVSAVWHRKVAALLGGVERSLAQAMELVPQSDPLPAQPEISKMDRLRELNTLLESEHKLALAEAESTVRENLGTIRSGLPSRTARWSPDHAQHEGRSEVAAEVQTVLCNATRLYLHTMEHSLTSCVPRSIHLAADRIGKLSPSVEDQTTQPLAGPEFGHTRMRKKEAGPGVLAIAAVALLPIYWPAAAAAAVGAVALSQYQRYVREQDFEREVRENATLALSRWVGSVEQDLIDRLREAVRPVLKGLIDRVAEGMAEDPPPPPRGPNAADVLERTRACLALIPSDVSVSSLLAEEVNP